jgi:hypothetical protein
MRPVPLYPPVTVPAGCLPHSRVQWVTGEMREAGGKGRLPQLPFWTR